MPNNGQTIIDAVAEPQTLKQRREQALARQGVSEYPFPPCVTNLQFVTWLESLPPRTLLEMCQRQAN